MKAVTFGMTGAYDGIDSVTFCFYRIMFNNLLENPKETGLKLPKSWIDSIKTMHGKKAIVTCIPNRSFHLYVEGDGLYVITTNIFKNGKDVKVTKYTFSQARTNKYKEGENSIVLFGDDLIDSKLFSEIDFSTWNTKNVTKFMSHFFK